MLLPATDQAGSAAPPSASSPAAALARSLLVVEDETVLREVTRRILDRNGYRVLDAASGPDALELITSHSERLLAAETDHLSPNGSAGSAAWRVKKKVAPSPTVPSAQVRPPCRSTI